MAIANKILASELIPAAQTAIFTATKQTNFDFNVVNYSSATNSELTVWIGGITNAYMIVPPTVLAGGERCVGIMGVLDVGDVIYMEASVVTTLAVTVTGMETD
jgi:hypothetical protein